MEVEEALGSGDQAPASSARAPGRLEFLHLEKELHYRPVPQRSFPYVQF